MGYAAMAANVISPLGVVLVLLLAIWCEYVIKATDPSFGFEIRHFTRIAWACLICVGINTLLFVSRSFLKLPLDYGTLHVLAAMTGAVLIHTGMMSLLNGKDPSWDFIPDSLR